MSELDFYRLYPGRVVDVGRRGKWTYSYRSDRRFFKTRFYRHGRRVPGLFAPRALRRLPRFK